MKTKLSLPVPPRIRDREFVIARQEAAASALRLRITQALTDQQPTSLRRLTVVVCNGEVTVSGKVDSYYHRQIAIAACLNTPGLIKLIDQITVQTD